MLPDSKCRNAMLRVNARQGAPTGGNSVIESLLVSPVGFFFFIELLIFYFRIIFSCDCKFFKPLFSSIKEI
jgi:hypothetical protein